MSNLSSWYKPRAARLLAGLFECTLEAAGHEGLIDALQNRNYRRGAIALVGLDNESCLFDLLRAGLSFDLERLGLFIDDDERIIGVCGGGSVRFPPSQPASEISQLALPSPVISLETHREKRQLPVTEDPAVVRQVAAAHALAQQPALASFSSLHRKSLVGTRAVVGLYAFAKVALFSPLNDQSSLAINPSWLRSIPFFVGSFCKKEAAPPYLLDVMELVMLEIEEMLHAKRNLQNRSSSSSRVEALFSLLAEFDVVSKSELRPIEGILRRDLRFAAKFGGRASLREGATAKPLPRRPRRKVRRCPQQYAPQKPGAPLASSIERQGDLFAW
ncbi:MAG: hypothetical protein GY822_07240 [Deltaproteobacteria bacterium]|nr:hypothetical protein [Deltaproteobacteria bacterium]